MTDAIQIVTTTASRRGGRRIAHAIWSSGSGRLRANLRAPSTSVYCWQGKIESSQEWQCTIKTRRRHYRAVEAMIRAVAFL